MPPKQDEHEKNNPSTPYQWWLETMALGLDPRRLDLTHHTSHSASKFTEEDFIHLKALWRNRNVDRLHITEHVRAEHVQLLTFLLARTTKASEEELAKHPLRQCLMEFVRTSSESLTDDDVKNIRLGAFLLVKSNLQAIRGINQDGKLVAGDLPKIRRSLRVMAKGQGEMAALTRQLGSIVIDPKGSGRPSTPPKAPRTPSPKTGADSSPELLATRELAVISPESMALENHRSRDEDSVNAALVSLLEAATLCSGIKKIGGRQGLKWHHTRQAFSLGPAENPVCEARTDGLLVLAGNPEYRLAILEVKPYLRRASRLRIEWQEACQMAAWISSSLGEKSAQRRNEGLLRTGDPTKKRRVLISQDYNFLYITIAEWGRAYEDYLYGRARPPTPPSKEASPSQDRGRPAAGPAAADIARRSSSGSLRERQPPVQQKAAATSSVPAERAPAHTKKPSAAGKNAGMSAAGLAIQAEGKTAVRAAVALAAAQANKDFRPDAEKGQSLAGQAEPAHAPNATATQAQKTLAEPAGQLTGESEKPTPTTEELDMGNFLSMNCYGPYSVSDPAHMAIFLRNVLALMLELSHPF